jgi:homeobox protein cut-like
LDFCLSVLDVHNSPSDACQKLATSTVTSLRSSLEASTALVQRLEADLELRTSGHGAGRASSTAPLPGSIPDTTLGLAELLADASPAIIGKKATVAGDGQQQLVSILQAQRDRYKEKLGQVESSLLYAQQQLEAVSAAKAQLEADNLSLYSKIRFLQSYAQGPNPKSMNIRSSSRLYPHQLNQGDEEYGLAKTNQQDVEQRYQQLYEQGMSPFQEVCSTTLNVCLSSS